MNEFEKAVRHALIDKNMQMNELAAQLGISNSYLYDILADNRKAEEMKKKIAAFLEIDISSLN